MASDINHTTFQGRLGKAPKSRFTPEGKECVNLSVGSNRYYPTGKQDANGKPEFKKQTAWMNVACWGNNADKAKKLVVGQEVIIQGRISTRTYEKDGQTQTWYEIVAESIQPGALPGAKSEDGAPAEVVFTDEDGVPF